MLYYIMARTDALALQDLSYLEQGFEESTALGFASYYICLLTPPGSCAIIL